MLEEFSQAPLCLELDLDSYEGHWSHVARFRGRSGWLVAANATLESANDIYRTTIVAACDEWENPIPAFQAEHLLECTWTILGPCYEYPSDILDDLLCEEEGQVYARWQRETNAALQRHLIATQERVEAVGAETRIATNRLLREINDLRRRRRFPGLTVEARSIFDTIIADLEADNDRNFETGRVMVAQIQADADIVEEGLLRREDVLVELGARYQFFWSAPKLRTPDRDPSVRRGNVGIHGTHSSPAAKWKYADVPYTRASIDVRLRRIGDALIEAERLRDAILAYPANAGRTSFMSQFGYNSQRQALAASRQSIRSIQAQRADLNKLRKSAK